MNMISEELRKYIDMVLLEEQNDQLFEMANLSSRRHGIDGVHIWVGIANKQHGLRVKVSNIRGKFSPDNCFVIQMPSLDYDPDQVANWIDAKTMKRILEWIKLNQQALYDFETGAINDTDEFLEKISKV